jgi:hypothetical protein
MMRASIAKIPCDPSSDFFQEGSETAMTTAHAPLLFAAVFASAVATPLHAANAGMPPDFRESFHFPLQDFWCENHLAVADFDRDGWNDIVLMVTALRNSNGPPWTYKCRAILLHNEGDGMFTDSIVADYPDSHYGYFAGAADLNGDGAPDLILRESSASHVLLNDGSGRAFQEASTFQPGYYALAFHDANGNGSPDLVSGTQTGQGGLIELFTNDGTGRSFSKTWQSRLYGSGLDAIETILSLDLNNDGRLDIAAREIYGGLLLTLLATNGAVPFVERSVVPMGARTFALAAGRVNGDMLPDLAAHVGWGQVRVFTNQGDGGMALHWQSPGLTNAAFNLALVDFDQDGFDDVFVGTFGDGALRVYRNNGGAGFGLWWQGSVPGQGFTGTAADLNGDGYPDLIAGEMNGIRVLVNCAGIPRIRKLSITQGLPTLTWTACPGPNYRVEYKDRLDGNQWTTLEGDVVASSFTASKTDTSSGSSRQRFYRVIKLP